MLLKILKYIFQIIFQNCYLETLICLIILVNNSYAFVSFVNLYVAIIVVLLEQNPHKKDCPIPVFSKRAVVIRELQFLYGGHREARTLDPRVISTML